MDNTAASATLTRSRAPFAPTITENLRQGRRKVILWWAHFSGRPKRGQRRQRQESAETRVRRGVLSKVIQGKAGRISPGRRNRPTGSFFAQKRPSAPWKDWRTTSCLEHTSFHKAGRKKKRKRSGLHGRKTGKARRTHLGSTTTRFGSATRAPLPPPKALGQQKLAALCRGPQPAGRTRQALRGGKRRWKAPDQAPVVNRHHRRAPKSPPRIDLFGREKTLVSKGSIAAGDRRAETWTQYLPAYAQGDHTASEKSMAEKKDFSQPLRWGSWEKGRCRQFLLRHHLPVDRGPVVAQTSSPPMPPPCLGLGKTRNPPGRQAHGILDCRPQVPISPGEFPIRHR